MKGEGQWVWWKAVDERWIRGCALGLGFVVRFLLVPRVRCHLPRVDLVGNLTATT